MGGQLDRHRAIAGTITGGGQPDIEHGRYLAFVKRRNASVTAGPSAETHFGNHRNAEAICKIEKMKQILEAAKEIQDFFEEKGWKFCFIGGISLQVWGIPRNTNDADITLITGIGSEEEFVRDILDRFQSRISVAPLEFFLPRRIVLINIGGVGVDISLGALEFEELAVERATYHEFLPGIVLKVCSPEDLIVFKAFANRLKDWADIENVLSVQTNLDWNYIGVHLSPLVELKEEPEILTTLKHLRTKA